VAVENPFRPDADVVAEQPLQGSYRYPELRGQVRYPRHPCSPGCRLDERRDVLAAGRLSRTSVHEKVRDDPPTGVIAGCFCHGDRDPVTFVAEQLRYGETLIGEPTHRGSDEWPEPCWSKQQPEHPALALQLPLKVVRHHAREHRSSVRLEDQNDCRRSDEGLFEACREIPGSCPKSIDEPIERRLRSQSFQREVFKRLGWVNNALGVTYRSSGHDSTIVAFLKEPGVSRTYGCGMDQRIGLLESMLDKTGDVVLAVDPDQHDLPTPCADFDVAGLLEHIALWIQVFDSAVNNKELGFDPNDHHIAADWHRLIVDAAKSIVSGLKDHGVDRQMTMTSAPMPGEFILNMLLMEYVGHSWDLTRACGTDTPHDELEAAAALAAATAIVLPEHRDSPMFAQAFEVPPDAPAIERFVAFLGRDPAWSPRQ